jgi:peptidoglycan L-alanyl-D-glutamate endopeptidase CwlK
MPVLGSASLGRRAQLHPDLQAIADEAIKIFDFSIRCAWRGPEEQEKDFKSGASPFHYPKSKHNRRPAMAMDCYPYPLKSLQDKEPFIALGAVMMTVASRLLAEGKITHKLRWGHDWDRDGILGERGEWDYPHYELVEEFSNKTA